MTGPTGWGRPPVALGARLLAAACLAGTCGPLGAGDAPTADEACGLACLRLTGTVSDAENGVRLAVLEHTGRPGARIVREGERIGPGMVLESVGERAAVLRVHGETATLPLLGFDPPPTAEDASERAAEGALEPAAAASPFAPPTLESLGPGRHAIAHGELRRLIENPALLLRQGRLRPLRDARGHGVLEVTAAPADGLAARLGLAEGDLVVAVSGRRADGIDTLAETLDNAAPGSEVSYVFLREREVHQGTLTVSADRPAVPPAP